MTEMLEQSLNNNGSLTKSINGHVKTLPPPSLKHRSSTVPNGGEITEATQTDPCLSESVAVQTYEQLFLGENGEKKKEGSITSGEHVEIITDPADVNIYI